MKQSEIIITLAIALIFFMFFFYPIKEKRYHVNPYREADSLSIDSVEAPDIDCIEDTFMVAVKTCNGILISINRMAE